MKIITLRVTLPDEFSGEGLKEQMLQDFADIGIEGEVEVLSETRSGEAEVSGIERGPLDKKTKEFIIECLNNRAPDPPLVKMDAFGSHTAIPTYAELYEKVQEAIAVVRLL